MAFVIDDVVAAALAAKQVAGALRDAVDSIKGGLGGNAKEKKAELADKVTKLEDSLAKAGTLARIGKAYAESLEDVLGLLFLSRRAERVLVDAGNGVHGPSNEEWRVLDTLFDSMDLTVSRKIAMDRQEFYDEVDRATIASHMRDFDAAMAKRDAHLGMRAAHELRRDAGQMRKALQDTEFLLRSTLYGKILNSLAQLGG